MRVLGFAFLGLAALLPNAAKADWQWSRWGMTVDQAVAASNGTARKADFVEQKKMSWVTGKENRVTMAALAHASHVAGGTSFNAWMLFDPASQQLKCVNMEPSTPVSSAALESKLVSAYGQPANRTKTAGIGMKETVWVTQQDTITLRELFDSPSIIYCNRSTSSSGF
jgi:hypothetical protein